jgi:integrase
VRKKGLKPVAKTFDTKVQAERWAKGVERGAETPIDMTVSQMIKTYRQLREDSGRAVDDTSSERYILEMLDASLGHHFAGKLVPKDLVEFATKRMKQANPATINQDIGKLGTVLRYVSSIKGIPFNDVVGAARPLLNHLHLISPGKSRTRRPSTDELERLFEYFREHADKTHLRMEDIVTAALTVGLRRGELFRVRWADLDEKKKMVLVRDRKHPRQKQGNDQWIPLIGEAWEVIQRQPRTGERIFPFVPATVSKYFKRACDETHIVDLHFHDMRREAASVLLEMGWHDRQVKMITGHGSKVFEVYAKPDPATLHKLPAPERRFSTKDATSST